MSVKKKVFMVEDDQNFGTVMKSYLEINGFEVTWVKDGANALKTFVPAHFDICILDVMLPHVDGFTIGKEIKNKEEDIPLIFLTAKTLKDDVLQGFGIGADDYVTKPFDSEILIAKINAILNRSANKDDESIQNIFTLGRIEFNVEMRTLTSPGKVEQLSPKEAELLRMLCLDMNRVMPREKALNKIWGENSYFTTRSMDVYITKLRKYLRADPRIEIVNIHGSGYLLKLEE
ncbi:DNA-binding response regulator, OmpR family, contains REC and winged-helix (wHTH) domain [Saccharicrinis carchari]|uniref:DNA-binding response regulator, OmpR family, contains REC and winged-helix (WHTH) domain n=1 Tax=Saccharicrinis carchari TaxID=1168039 RepID=A0A521B1E4_SACCC|nr:response regulator transcription factor [Saccharicrinis carchari]SMO40869.1 DNA-binding response regulator, OmpR family, contains REC and winged-helix (wHTH) domain [Saccharicrinis carchari]